MTIPTIKPAPSRPILVPKAWGCELWFANDDEHNYCGKELRIWPGWRLSMHRHLEKDETFYVLSGRVLYYHLLYDGPATVDDPDIVPPYLWGPTVELTPGMSQHVPVGTWHMLEYRGLSDDSRPASIIEASTFHSDDDVERMWPSTEIT